MVGLVERMLAPSAGAGQALHKQFPKAKTPHIRANSLRATAEGSRDRTSELKAVSLELEAVPALLHELHGLTKDEIRIVEGAAP
jgi:hypothetical protein